MTRTHSAIIYAICNWDIESTPAMTSFEELTRELTALSPSDFQLVRSLGEGAFGKVVLAMYIPAKMLVAQKQIDLEKLEGKGELESVVHELRVLDTLRKHQSMLCPRFYGYYVANHQLMLVSEYCPFGDLRDLLERCGPLPADTLRSMGA